MFTTPKSICLSLFLLLYAPIRIQMRVNKTKCLKRTTCFALDTRHTWQTTPQKQKQQQKNKSNLNWLSELIKEEVGVKLSDNIFAGNDKVVNKINVKKEMAKNVQEATGYWKGGTL